MDFAQTIANSLVALAADLVFARRLVGGQAAPEILANHAISNAPRAIIVASSSASFPAHRPFLVVVQQIVSPPHYPGSSRKMGRDDLAPDQS
jgi:hypothetical protein